ncbi:uncharacterized protein An01g12180 [Aspergillus niger]|uniref:Contig An01c0350, genomic contig n=2 Tax=Aspergillus niger TaxID=5061 RepID=A2QAN6_ASPNC|nr:uncharacterized protein An01g12180 [Aspergillus niger]CAK44117.1 unnamed protein product [Aspergillus niger]
MGKRGKKGGGGRERQNWQQVARENAKFESYYNEQGFIPEEEREAFWEAIRRDLPNSFRFTGSRGHALAVQEKLKNFYIPEITSIKYEGKDVEPPRPVPWYPDQLAWSMTTPKQVVRRFAPFASFQKFLVAETEVGNISRQEVVSMIPPLLLDVKPGMTVLDMCAAPGSKSAQLMEMIHAGEEESMQQVTAKVAEGTASAEPMGPEGLGDDGRTTGLLIANDADYKRAHMLIHQMKRLSSPNLIVTNHDATMFPSIRLPPEPAPEGKPVKNKYLKFDRILADVPCTGDGTARKNWGVWKDWNYNNALGLYATQVRILVRALQMLKVGGRVVYSTCSMNPIENEAVIASALERCGSANVRILDCSNELPGLKRAPGLKTWKVMDREGRMYNSWKEVEERKEREGISGLGRVAEGMFPPTEDLPLDRCLRIYPHMQDTGGFFITVLEKVSEIRAKPEDSSKVIPKASIAALTEELDFKQKNGDEAQPQAAPQKRKNGQPIEEPFKYLDPNQEELDPIYKFYEISDRFPRDRFMVRNAEAIPARTIYYTSSLARDILTANEKQGMKFVHCGVKMFVRQDVQRPEVCRWRIQTDGLRILNPWLGPARAVTLTKKETLHRLLVEMFPKVDGDSWTELGEIGERVRDIPMGCSILHIKPDADETFHERMTLPLWRSLHSVNLMLPKEDRRAMLQRLFNDDTPLVNTTQKREAQSSTPITPATEAVDGEETPVTAPAETEEEVIKRENLQLGEDEQEQMDTRETYSKAGDEEDRFNTTV